MLARGSALLLALLLVSSLVYNAVTAPTGVDPERAGLPGRFVEVAGTRTYVETAGTGETPIVLLHGFGHWSFTWRETLRALGADGRFTAYAIDMRGFGFTDRPADTLYNAEGYARHVSEFLDAARLERPILVGNSLGGEVAIRVALARRGRVRGLVLVATSNGGSPSWAAGLCRIVCLPPFHRTALRLYVRHFIDGALGRGYFDPSSVDLPEVADNVRRALDVAGAEDAVLAMTRTNSARMSGDEVKQVRVPTLVIWGENDAVVPLDEGRRLASDITGARLVTYPQTGHHPQEEQPEQFAADLIAFAGELAPRR